MAMAGSMSLPNHPDDMEIKPGIAEMIREEERVSKVFFSHIRSLFYGIHFVRIGNLIGKP